MKIEWKTAGEFEDILYEKSPDGIAKVTINRPQVRNAFRPETVMELRRAFTDVREDQEIGCQGAGRLVEAPHFRRKPCPAAGISSSRPRRSPLSPP